MSRIIHVHCNNQASVLAQLQVRYDGVLSGTEKQVGKIIADIRAKGDQALIRYTKKWDHHSFLVVTPDEKKQASELYPKGSPLYEALALAKERISAYHRRQMPQDLDYTDEVGVRLGNLWRPIETVGMYVPGGLASYPSSVLMNAIPALVAGVKRLVMTVPAPNNQLNPAVLVAAEMLGIQEIFKIGGAQAIAALAYGTQTIPVVDKVVGPGNLFVATAKRQVFGNVGIDMVAGPSEVLIVAEASSDPEWVAADLLSQAEHDSRARALLITDDAAWAKRVLEAVDRQVVRLNRSQVAQASWKQYGTILVIDQLSHAATLINAIAPEHLQLMVNQALIDTLLPEIRHAGAIFLGVHTPEAIGDYIAGPSHVLPTSGTARFSSGLSVYDFLKRISLIGCSHAAFDELSSTTELLAHTESLEGHAHSIAIRKGRA